MLKKIGFLTPEQFKLAAKLSRVSPKGQSAAEQVLVYKKTQSEVAKTIQVSREKVRQYCDAIYKKHLQLIQCPPGWISSTLCLPKDQWPQLKQLEKNLRMQYSKNNTPQNVDQAT